MSCNAPRLTEADIRDSSRRARVIYLDRMGVRSMDAPTREADELAEIRRAEVAALEYLAAAQAKRDAKWWRRALRCCGVRA